MYAGRSTPAAICSLGLTQRAKRTCVARRVVINRSRDRRNCAHSPRLVVRRPSPPRLPTPALTRPAPPAPPPPAAADEEGLAEAAYAAALAEAMQMKVKELRGALAARNVGWADCLEKQALRGWGATSRLFSCSLTGTLSCLGAGCGAAGGALAPSSNLPGTLLGARG